MNEPIVKLFQKVYRFFSKKELAIQLRWLLVAGVSIMVISVSLGTSIIVSRNLTNNYIENGSRIAETLAKESTIPVFLGSLDFAEQIFTAILAFPDVVQIAVYEGDNLLIKQFGGNEPWYRTSEQAADTETVMLEAEGDKYWQFVSPVYAEDDQVEDDEFLSDQATVRRIGTVRVLLSKESLNSARDNIIYGNIVVLFFVAFLLVLGMNFLSRRLTQPLGSLVDTMSQSSSADRRLRVTLQGSVESRLLGEAFNEMMEKLEDREHQLAYARDQALDSARMKSEFAANVSHEIRTPLNGVLGTLQLLSDADLDPEYQHMLELAKTSSESLMLLINDILDFSRLSLDYASLVDTEFDLRALLEDLVFLHAQSLDAKALDISLFYDPMLPDVVQSDPNKLRQLMNNLINNAVKFTDTGYVSVSAKKEVDSEGALWINISVKDSGIGITQSDLRTIFMPYSQSDGSMTRKYSGTGLGLSICEKLAELLGGDIGVYSELHHGSQFYVKIPFSCKSSATPHRAVNYPWSGHRAVVVSSSQALRDSAKNFCQLNGLKPVVVNDFAAYQKAVQDKEAALQHTIVLVIKSNNTPQDNWVEKVLQRVAEHKLKTIVLSSKVDHHETIEQQVQIQSPIFKANVITALQKLYGKGSVVLAGQSDHVDKGYPFNLLLVEDNYVNQKVAKALLEKLGCTVKVASNGREAIGLAEKEAFALIIMDCQMPVMNGYDATRLIRLAEGFNQSTPIIAMTANVGERDKEHCFDAGMNDFLGKPFKTDEMVALLDKWLLSSSETLS